MHQAGTPILRRADGRFQLGVEPGRAVVVDGLDDAEAEFVRSLAKPRHQARVDDPQRAGDIVGVLQRYGALAGSEPTHPEVLARLGSHPGPPADAATVVAARADRHVVVDGRGGIVADIAHHLRRAGIGQVHHGWQCADAAARRHRRPDLVVLVGTHAISAGRGVELHQGGVAHLPVVLHAGSVVAGPLVGADRAGPCLTCHDLARRDVDPSWPLLLSQVLPLTVSGEPVVRCGTVLAALGVGVTGALALDHLDALAAPSTTVPDGGHDGRIGADLGQIRHTDRVTSIQLSLPGPALHTRPWVRHAACHHHGAAGGASAA